MKRQIKRYQFIAACSHLTLITEENRDNQMTYKDASATMMMKVMIQKCEHAGPKVTTSHDGDIQRKDQRSQSMKEQDYSETTHKVQAKVQVKDKERSNHVAYIK